MAARSSSSRARWPNNFAINAGGGTVDAHGGQLNLQGVIADGTGPGLLTLIDSAGGGSVQLSGVNTYTGGTLVNGTTVIVSNNSSVGTGAVTLNNAVFQADGSSNLSFANNFTLTGGNTIDANGTTLTIAGNITGAGAVEFFNSGGPPPGGVLGTVVLLGNNSYTGGTLICSCTTLQLGDATHTASIIGTVDVEGQLNVVNADMSGITTIFNDGLIKFRNATSASQIPITNAGRIDFLDTSTAANSTILSAGLIRFSDSATVGSANITNEFFGEIDFFNTATAAKSTIVNQTGGLLTFNNSATAGSASITNMATGETDFYDTSTAGNATILNQSKGVTTFQVSSTAGNANITNLTGGQLFFYDNSSAGNATIINNSAGNNANPVPEGVFFTGASTAGNAIIINNHGGAIDFGFPGSTTDTPTAGNASITNNSGSTLQFSAFSTGGNATITTQSGAAVAFFNHSTGGNAQFITNGTGYVDFSNSRGPNGDGKISAGSIAGSGNYYIGGGNTLTVGGNNLSTVVSGVIANTRQLLTSGSDSSGATLVLAGLTDTITTISSGFTVTPLSLAAPSPFSSVSFDSFGTAGAGSLVKTGSGTLTLSGTNTYTGTTTVNGGFLDVEGSIASSSLTTVNAGGALTGAGVVGNTSIASGGIFVPGNGFGTSTTVQGNLAFQSGALYLVQLNSTASTSAKVSGTAGVNGNVGVTFDPAGFIMKKYVILQAQNGVSGTFNGVSTPANLVGNISYDPTHAFLNLNLNYGPNLNTNQQNVANTLSNFFNSNGSISAVLASLTPSGLSQTAGEIATGTQQATFNAMNMFMQLLSDPFVSGRGGGTATGGGAQPYAAEDNSLAYAARQPGSARDALARMPTKADVARNDLFDNR
jgi:autotransporter-associated beta strand protein